MNPFRVDAVIILSLDKREALWIPLAQNCQRKGWYTQTFLVGDGELLKEKYVYDYTDVNGSMADKWTFGTLETRIHHYNALASHKAIVKLAKAKSYKKILLLEDDSYITARFEQVVSLVASQVAALDYDLLYLGWWIGSHQNDLHYKENITIEEDWSKYRLAGVKKVNKAGAGGFHGVIINNRLYDTILDFPMDQPLDGLFNAKGHENLKSFYVFPKVVHTLSTFSHCEGRHVERDVIP